MSNQKGQKPVHSSSLAKVKTWPQKICLWLRNNIPSGLRFMGYAMFGIAVVLIVIGLIALVSGQSGTISRFVDRNFGGDDGNVAYANVTGYHNWMWVMLVRYYSYLLPLFYLMIIILPLVIALCVLSIFDSFGRFVMRLPYSLAGGKSLSARLLSVLVVWTGVIVVAWLMINADPVLTILLWLVGLLLANLAFFAGEHYWLQRWPVVTERPTNIEAEKQQ